MRSRFREAREYIGLSISEAALAAEINSEKIGDIENDKLSPTPSEMLCFSTIYQRPPRWLRGEAEPPVDLPAELDNLLERSCVSDHDRSEIVGFVEFLRHRARLADK